MGAYQNILQRKYNPAMAGQIDPNNPDPTQGQFDPSQIDPNQDPSQASYPGIPPTGQPTPGGPSAPGSFTAAPVTMSQYALPGAVAFNNSQDPRTIAANQRQLVWGKGDVLNQGQQDAGNVAAMNAAGYAGVVDPVEQQMAAGQGGYNPQEAADIKGNTDSFSKYFNPDSAMSNLKDSQQGQQKAVQGLKGGLQGSIDPSTLQMRPGLPYEIYTNLKDQTNDLRSAVDTEQSGLKSAIDPNKLGVASTFNKNYLMSPEEQQNIVTGAGISAGLKDEQAVGDLQRSALAAGDSPLGVAAYQQRMARQQAIDAGNAMTQARIGASNAAAQRQQTAETMRIGAQEDISGRQMTAATTIGGQQAQNINTVDLTGQQEDIQMEQNRLAAQQYLTGAKMQAATTGGEADIQQAETATGQQQQQQQYATTTGTNIAEQQDAANSSRAQQVANTRLNQQNVGLQAQQNQEQTQNANSEASKQRQLGTYSTQATGSAAAANTGIAASQTPTAFSTIVGGLAGGIGALAGAEKGEIINRPSIRLVGERGPEAVIPIKPKKRYYGEAA